MRKRRTSRLRKAIICLQRFCSTTGVVTVAYAIGTIGGIENNEDLFYGTIKLIISAALITLLYMIYQLLELALYREHKRRVEREEEDGKREIKKSPAGCGHVAKRSR